MLRILYVEEPRARHRLCGSGAAGRAAAPAAPRPPRGSGAVTSPRIFLLSLQRSQVDSDFKARE